MTDTRPVDLSRIVKAYDVRGTAFVDFTTDAARALGAAFADLLDAGAIVVAHDMRVSSPALATAFAEGAVQRGSTVAFAGLSSTDQLYCASGLYDAAGAQITASHNPAEDNGIKMCFPGARPLGRDSGLDTVRDRAQRYLDAGTIPEREGGRREDVDTLADYIRTMLSLVQVPTERPLKVVVDAANAMAGYTVPALARHLASVEIIPLYFELDGSFPNHEANPLDYSTLADLRAAVRNEGADMGLAFDGDADRCIVIDERGEVVSPSAVTALIARNEIARAHEDGEQQPAVVANVVSSRAVREHIEAAGGRCVRSRVGHSIIKALMAQENAVFGGEHSAHYYFRDFFYADSGMLAALHVLRVLASSESSLSELMSAYDPYVASGEINSRVTSVDDARERVLNDMRASYPHLDVDELDGYTLTHWPLESHEGGRWWLSLRASNTEALLRLNVEAEDEATMQEVRDRALEVIRADHSSDSPLPVWASEALRCPACGHRVRMSADSATCVHCGAVYEVMDAIPMLLT